MRRAELRCYLVVLKSIQRDRNGGLVSVRQAARRARISLNSAQKALASLVRGGWLLRHGERRAGYTYGLPFLWMGDERRRAIAVAQHPYEELRGDSHAKSNGIEAAYSPETQDVINNAEIRTGSTYEVLGCPQQGANEEPR
jgi:hypothetical protein